MTKSSFGTEDSAVSTMAKKRYLITYVEVLYVVANPEDYATCFKTDEFIGNLAHTDHYIAEAMLRL